MAEQPPPSPRTAAQLEASLREVADRLRAAKHLDPDTQQTLAELVDELVRAMESCALPSPETATLAESAAQLAHALGEQHNAGLLEAAKRRLEVAAARAESEAPLATAVVQRLIDTLANLGI